MIHLSTEVSHSNEPFVFQQSHPFSLKWQTFRNSQEKQKVAFHENIAMSYYKPCSKILQKAAKGSRSSKMKAKWRDVTFQLSHCTLCFEIVGHDCRIWNNFFWHHMIPQIVTWQKFLAPTCSITPKIGFTIQCCHGLPDQPKPKNSQKITNVTSRAKHCVGKLLLCPPLTDTDSNQAGPKDGRGPLLVS